jgi:hypothetical protein
MLTLFFFLMLSISGLAIVAIHHPVRRRERT